MKKETSDGLASIAVAIIMLGILWFAYKAGSALIHHTGPSGLEARCESLSGVYGDGKCFVNGEEV